ncbi:hypothetical protein acsn021_35930 [Anaerocolumna cellulosilytica]|uniref:Uncharacterized protein n=1 Tax=Anaerocolumna cellulosilytica TaxID=433286 RepID=A0A6S6QZE5_9FIRM|nr:hypothetical protein [Anaerocolumna cellulosilytica]MBB5195491.1 hypothetical protein [Anaerocolumna cellulosilytica]BCJ96024.1 hypothetical protein acsn021_35930 [Anaerocolumna cellulosilytica]
MLRILKWEFIRRLREQGIFYVVLVIISGSLYILKDVDRTKDFLPAMGSLYGGFLYVLINIFSILYLIYGVRKPVHTVEHLSYLSIYKVLGAKLINNGIFYFFMYFGLKFLERGLSFYNTENVRYLVIGVPFDSFAYQFSFILPCAVLLLYLILMSFSLTKQFPLISMFIVLGILMWVVYITGFGNPIRQYLMLQHDNVGYIVNILVFSILFYSCCKLYEKKFELSV